jgi:DNA-binding response OmpR family regulator
VSGPAATGGPERHRLVLVVDDDALIRRLLRDVLEVDDWEVVEATDGEHALALADSEQPVMVVLDLLMPGLDGLEVCRRLDHERVKVLVLSGTDDRSSKEASLAAGADAYMAKPFSSVDLLELLPELLDA